jgi:DNA-binding SARP family transcriptional activator
MTLSETALPSGPDVDVPLDQACGWRVLGEVAVEVGGTAGTLTGQRQRAVLAYLILHANTSITVDELSEALWAGDPPMTARNSIQRFIADIRRRLGPAAHRLQTTSSGYRLAVHEGESDVDRARVSMELGRDRLVTGDATAASAYFQSGLSEFRGQPLAGVGDVWFRGTSATELEELRRSLREGSFEAGLALGLHHRLMEVLHRFANDNPHRESAWALLMVALYRSGRQHDALEAAKTLRRRLLEDLGIDPSPTITDLIHQILNHARDLQLAPRPDGDDLRPVVWRAPLPSQLVRVLTSEVVGRDDELRLASDAIDELVRGNPRVTLVCGEPGIGKTRLAAEFAQRADQRGAITYYGRSDEDTAVPLGAWAEVLTDLIAANRSVIDELGVATIADDLHELVPELGGPSSGAPASLGGSETRRASLFRSVVQLLDGVAATQPIVLVLDDLQWAEASTTQLLRHVARNLRGPVWLIGLLRDTDVDERHPVSDVVASLRAEPHVDVLGLGGLDDDGTAALVRSLLPDIDTDELVGFASHLTRETSGNPFFASEIVRDLIEAVPDGDPGAALRLRLRSAVGEAALPDSVRQVVRQRVGRLGDSVTRTLRTASVFGRHFDLRALAAVCRHDESTVLADLEAALDAALVSEAPGSPDRFSFVHDLVHHSLYHDLSESRRRRLHARCALALRDRDRSPVDDRTSRAGEIAGHFIAADDPALAAETIEAIRVAASEAARRHDPDEAATLLTRAVALLESDEFVDGAGETLDVPRTRVRLLVERGTYLRNAGHRDFRTALLAAGRAAEEIGDVDAQVDAALANTRGLQTNIWEIDDDRIEQLESAIAALGNEQSTRRANLLASLASEKWHDDHRAESAVYRADSIALARQLGDPETLANVLTRASRARNSVAPAEEHRRLSIEMQRLVELGHDFDPYLMVNLLRAIQNQSLRDADPELLASTTAAIHAYGEERPLAKCQRAAILSDVLLTGLRGDGDEYLRLSQRAAALLAGMADPEATITQEAHLFYGLFLLGRTHEVLDQAIRLADERPHIDLYQAVAAHGVFLAGDHDDVRRRIDAGMARGFSLGVDDYTVQALQHWADPAAGVRHVEACRELYVLLSPHSGRLSGHVIHVTQPIDLSLGRLCHALGRTSAALAHLDVSADIARRFDARWMAEQTDVSRARVLINRAADGDLDTARSLLGDAVEQARANHHPAVEADARALLEQID